MHLRGEYRSEKEKPCRRQKRQLKTDVKEEQRRYHKHEQPCQKEQILRVALAPEHQPDEGSPAHDAGAYGRRHHARQQNIEKNRRKYSSGTEASRQAQDHSNPRNHGGNQTDMGTGHGQNVHDPRCRIRLQQGGVDSLIAAEQHRKDCRCIRLRHDRTHVLKIVRTDLCRAAHPLFP